MTIDDKTVDDIVGLIEAEMAEAAGDCVNSPERLAGVILDRLGYEIPEPLPTRTIYLHLLKTGIKVAELYLTMKAAVEKSYPGVGLSTHIWGGNLEYEDFLDALREAGVDI